MWSLGCVAAELFLGLPLFPAASERDLLARVTEMLGSPPLSVLRSAKHTKVYFKEVEVQVDGRRKCEYKLLSEQEFEARNSAPAPSGKRYFMHTKLADIITAYPIKETTSSEDAAKEERNRECFVDFLLGVLEVDPRARWTPHQAALHPFISGDEFKGPFQPPPAPDSGSSTDPVGFQDPKFARGHSVSWHADAFHAHSVTSALLQSPAHARAHAQAHAIALAAVQHLSPQLSPQFSSSQGCGCMVGLPAATEDSLSQPFPIPVVGCSEAARVAAQQQMQKLQEPSQCPELSRQISKRHLSALLPGYGLSPRTSGPSPAYVPSIPGSRMSPVVLDTIAAVAGAAAAAAQESVRQQLGCLTGLGPLPFESNVDKPPPPVYPVQPGAETGFSPRLVGIPFPGMAGTPREAEVQALHALGLQHSGDASSLALDSARGECWAELRGCGMQSGDAGEAGSECPAAAWMHDDEDGNTVEECSQSPGDLDPDYW